MNVEKPLTWEATGLLTFGPPWLGQRLPQKGVRIQDRFPRYRGQSCSLDTGPERIDRAGGGGGISPPGHSIHCEPGLGRLPPLTSPRAAGVLQSSPARGGVKRPDGEEAGGPLQVSGRCSGWPRAENTVLAISLPTPRAHLRQQASMMFRTRPRIRRTVGASFLLRNVSSSSSMRARVLDASMYLSRSGTRGRGMSWASLEVQYRVGENTPSLPLGRETKSRTAKTRVSGEVPCREGGRAGNVNNRASDPNLT